MPDQEFGGVSKEFIAYYNQVRGHVREQVVRRNLLRHVRTDPLKIADVGGGDGRDSEWLAGLGHDVLMVEPDTEMMRLAKKREPNFHTLKGNIDTLLSSSGEGRYDLVASHAVLQYVLDAPHAHLDKLVRLLKPGGLLSLLNKGYNGAIDRLTRQGRTSEIDSLQRTHQTTNNLGKIVWAFDEIELDIMIEKAGASVLEWFGVRIVSDNDTREIETVDEPELAEIIRMETRLAQNPLSKAAGQMLHFIAQKPA